MLVPFLPGQTWYVCQGYRGVSHLSGYALDMSNYPATPNTQGCNSAYKNSATGQWVTAPGSGILGTPWSDGVCFRFDAGGSFKLGHISVSGLVPGARYRAGQQISTINAPGSSNGNFAHLHMSAYSDTNCATPVPLSGSARLDCVANLPYGPNYTGTAMRQCESDIATFYDGGYPASTEHVWTSNGSSLSGAAAWWNSTGYPMSQVGNRYVSGDFNGDGKDDTATMYDYGSSTTTIHVWLSNGSSLAYQGNAGWWTSSGGYSVAQIVGRYVSGDFNGDGKDDVAVFYDYGGSGAARIHVWLSTGSSFTYQGDLGWWNVASGYSPVYVGDRMTVGDFDRNGKDDVAVMYDYGLNNTRIHVFLSTGSGFTYSGPSGWWASAPYGYAVSAVGARFEAGDFNADGRSDVAAFYSYGGGASRIHVWLSTGTTFQYQGDNGWYSFLSGYDLAQVGARFLANDLNADGRDDIAAFYLATASRINVWLSTGSGLTYQGTNGWWSSGGYDLTKVSGRFVAGSLSGQ